MASCKQHSRVSHWIRVTVVADLDVRDYAFNLYTVRAGNAYPVLTYRCRDCNAQLPFATPANDKGRATEIGAARIHAGYMECNDLDDVINNPVLRNILGHMIGECNLDPAAVEIYDLAMEMQSDAG